MTYASFESSEVNPSWEESRRGRRITICSEPFIKPDTKIFASGSCFAVEIRRAMRFAGYRIFPDYSTLVFDPAMQSPGKLPERDNINHYDTYVIRQEIEHAIGGRHWKPDDFWTLSRHRLIRRKGRPRVCKDPYRRDIHAADMDALAALSTNIGRCIAQGLEAADVVVITLELTECCWPSFKWSMTADVFREDGRHVLPHAADRLVGGLIALHRANA